MTDLNIRPIIGLEIHVQLATRTKLFCGCELEFGAEPNTRVCPVCMGLPGALPVMNCTAYEFALRAGAALHCRIPTASKWDRKSYYYPDMPKNYQISQYDQPIASDGYFEIPVADPDAPGLKRIGIIRAHLEEDAGKNLHEGLDHTRVDLNRAGTPLLEIVTRPDIADADEAHTFCFELQRLVRHLGISEANMQQGQMRFEPNVNVAITAEGVEYRTPISEIKNLNSFRSVRSAIDYEIRRQIDAWQTDHDYTLDSRGKQNYGWNDRLEATEFQRGKEESHDYRYFPDPDLLPVEIDSATPDRLRSEIGELPVIRQRRFNTDYAMTDKDCEVILADRATGDLFDAAIAAGASPETLTKQFVGVWNHLASARGKTVGRLGIVPATAAELVALVANGKISAGGASRVAEAVLDDPAAAGNLLAVAERLGVVQVRDSAAMQAWIDEAFAANPQAVADALGDNPRKAKAAPGFLRGQVMKISKGKADPRAVGELIEAKIQSLR